jgi:hypothetical protein
VVATILWRRQKFRRGENEWIGSSSSQNHTSNIQSKIHRLEETGRE